MCDCCRSVFIEKTFTGKVVKINGLYVWEIYFCWEFISWIIKIKGRKLVRMRAVQLWRLAAALFWTVLSISLFVEFTSAAPGSGQDANSENSQNNLNRRGMRALREMRNLRRSHRSKFPLKPADPQRKSKRNSGKKIKNYFKNTKH